MSFDESEPLLLNDLGSNGNPDNIDCVVEVERTEQVECNYVAIAGTSREAVPGKDVIQKLLVDTKIERELNSDISLPEGKDAHLFISYSSDDSKCVLPIIAELEQTHKLSCIFDARDFTAGMDIHANIKRSMERSMKVLLFLSDNYLQSSWCNHEISLAFIMSIKTRQNIIIPVKLDECNVPSTLEPLTYIDRNTDNLVERIVEAYNSTETDVLPEDFGPARQWENGYSITLDHETETTCCPRPSRIKVVLSDETRQNLKAVKFQVSENIVQDAADIANYYISTGRWSRSKTSVCCCLLFCTCPYIFLAMAFIWGIIGITVYEHRFSQKTVDVQSFWQQAFLTMLIVGNIITIMVILMYYKLRLKADLRRLKADVFKLTLKTYKDGVCFEVTKSGSSVAPTIKIIRYNVRPCQAYLASKIKQFVVENYGEIHAYSMDVFEERADLVIRHYLDEYIYCYVPDAPFNRHNVKGGRSCMCQVIEPFIGKHVQSWKRFSTAHQIEEV